MTRDDRSHLDDGPRWLHGIVGALLGTVLGFGWAMQNGLDVLVTTALAVLGGAAGGVLFRSRFWRFLGL
jgi:uncharacterized protein YcfJ